MNNDDHDHVCHGPIIYDGLCEIHVVAKANNGGIMLYADGAIRKCNECGWPFANTDEAKFGEQNHVA